MSFRDDFNSLDQNVWEIVNHVGDQASVTISDGKLRFGVVNLTVYNWFGIHRKSFVDLKNKSVELNLDFELQGIYGPTFHFGVCFSNKPYENCWDSDFLGVFIGIEGEARGRPVRIKMYKYSYGKAAFLTAPVERVPCTIRVKVSEKAIYVYEVVDGVEKAKLSAVIEFNPVNLHFYLLTRVVVYEGAERNTGAVTIDYVDVKETTVPETVQETIAREMASLVATMVYTLVPLAMIMMTILEVRRAIKEAKPAG